MEELSSITFQLKEQLVGVIDNKVKENIIIEHIKAAEKLNCVVGDFPPNLDWFNTSQPLTSSLLHGKIVVLDFFTYCCINCLHVLPHLKQLEENFSVADGLVVIGVHSAKFDNEKDSGNILLALKRYNISHPVVNDKECYLWNKLNISCWPTILILGPKKQVIFVLVGEGQRDELLLFVKIALKFYSNSILPYHLPLIISDQIVTSSLISFPSKITRWKNLLAVSDSGNHRVLILNEDGFIQFKIGGKAAGFKDGIFEIAQFNSPQGLAFYNSDILYVADTENHAIRLINLVTLKVTTEVGNGQQGSDLVGGKTGKLQEISSPWDICVVPCSDIEITSIQNSMSENLLPTPPFPTFIPPPPPPTPPFPTSIPAPPPKTPPLQTSLPPPLPPPPLTFSTSGFPPPPPFISKPLSSKFSSTLSVKDLNTESKVLLIAAAGTHQIWAFFIDDGIWWKGKMYKKNTCVAIAGTGKEENRNNRYPMMASFAQPSGLAYSPELKMVFIADSESSSIRKLSLKDGSVSHLIGGARSPDDLFSFGDVDGKGYDAKLQHPLGIFWNTKQKALFVCDTYNHKLKQINISQGICMSIHKSSTLFNEPSGCCGNESEDILYVSDTNNNCIKIVTLSDGSIKKFNIIEEPQLITDTAVKSIWEIDSHLSKTGGTLNLRIDFIPQEIHGKWKLKIDESKIKINNLKGKLENNILELVFNIGPSEETDILLLFFDLVLCGNETCDFKKLALKVNIKKGDLMEKDVFCKLTKNLL